MCSEIIHSYELLSFAINASPSFKKKVEIHSLYSLNSLHGRLSSHYKVRSFEKKKHKKIVKKFESKE